MRRVWRTPGGEVSRLYLDMLQQVHLLIAGATGSGKSTVVNGIMCAALLDSPADKRFILIDPKKVELRDYAAIPHCIEYAQTGAEAVRALQDALNIVYSRYAEMDRKRLRMYRGSDVYVVIDELVPLLTNDDVKRDVVRMLQELLTIARAARVHVVACSQHIPTIPTALRCNFDSSLGLRTRNGNDSRNIIGRRGCERFPAPASAGVAYGYYARGADLDLYVLPQVEDAERGRLLGWWNKHSRPVIKWA